MLGFLRGIAIIQNQLHLCGFTEVNTGRGTRGVRIVGRRGIAVGEQAIGEAIAEGVFENDLAESVEIPVGGNGRNSGEGLLL